MRKITNEDISRWKNNTIDLAISLGYKKEILDQILKITMFENLGGFPPKGNWYGWCMYSFPQPRIAVYECNVTSFFDYEKIKEALEYDGMPINVIDSIINHLKKVSLEDFFEVYNQSGMDHELIGHLYHYINDEDHSEKAASLLQIEFAKHRKSKAWKIILQIMPIILGYHKNVDELKG